MIRVYTASKLTTASEWRDLERSWPHVFFHARWLKHNLVGTPDLQQFAEKFWLEDEQDVRSADAVLVWGRSGEHLRGALVEAGMAIAFGVPVIVVGAHPDYGTWQYHKGVFRCEDIVSAGMYLQQLDSENGTGQREHE